MHKLGSSGDEGCLQRGTGDLGGSGGGQNVCENTAIKSKNKIKIRKYSNFKKLPREALSQKPKKKCQYETSQYMLSQVVLYINIELIAEII